MVLSFKEYLTEGRGLFTGHHVGDGVVFIDGPYSGKGSWTIASHDIYSDVHIAVQELVEKGFEIASQWTGPDKQVTDDNKVKGATKGRIIVLNGEPNLIIVIYSGSAMGGVSPRRFGLRYAASTESLDLKPQALGIRDQEYNMDDLADAVINTLYERPDIDPALAGYLELMIEYYWNNQMPKIAQEIKDEYGDMLSKFPMGQIKKNFGEIVGPFAILNSKSDLFKDMKFSTRDKAYFPLRGNEPLVDFYLVKGGKRIPFSAKSGKSTTNTVKSADIIPMIDNNSEFLRKHGDSIEVQVLRDLHTNSGVDGPMVAAFNLKKSVREFKKITKEMLNHWISNSARKGATWKYVPELYDDFVEAIGVRTSGRKKPTFGEILYYTEVAICNASKGNKAILNYSEIFDEVVGGAVNYINLLNIGKDGLPQWHTSEGGNSRVIMRTKNGTNRIAADKLGLQILS
jgi:hypothetical protein